MTKVTYLSFGFLLLIIPRNKFKNKYFYNIIIFLIISSVVLLYSHFTTPLYDFSRMPYYIYNNVNASLQMQYLLNHPIDSIIAILKIIPDSLGLYPDNFKFCIAAVLYDSTFITTIGLILMTMIIFFYPLKEKIKLNLKLKLFLIVAITVFGTYMIQLLKWTSVGDIFNIIGVQARYFIPLLPILPIIFNIDVDFIKENSEIFDKIIIISSIIMMNGLVLTLLKNFY